MNEFENPGIDILEEIEEQGIDVSGGGIPSPSVTTLGCMGVSWALGNDGIQCTLTVECQAHGC